MNSEAMTLYKLIILYILNQVDFSLTNAQVSNIILEKGYTNYFNIQTALSELEENSLIKSKTIRNSSYFIITNAGRETLTFFNKEISDAIKSEITDYLKKNRYSLREEVSTVADYYEEKKGEYKARCYVKEKDTKIIELTLDVPNEEAAISICTHWKEKSQEIYESIMRELL